MRMFHLTHRDLATASRSQLEYEIYAQEEIHSLFDEDRLTSGRYTIESYRTTLRQWTEED